MNSCIFIKIGRPRRAGGVVGWRKCVWRESASPRSGILAWRECSIPGLAPSLAWESGSYAIFIVGGVAMALALGSPPINLYKSVCKRSAGIWTIFHSHGFSFTGSNLWEYCSLDAFNVLQCFANTFLSAFTRRLRLEEPLRPSGHTSSPS